MIASIYPHLEANRIPHLESAVSRLQAAIEAGLVMNKQFSDAKDIFNRVAHDASEKFLASGPHIEGRNGEPHHQSDWWLKAYDVDAFVSGCTNIPTAIKRAGKAGMAEYVAFLNALLPLHDMLQAAKPLIKKRGEVPAERTPKQIADDADRMTCQCCGRRILANLGKVAHHGYERPGYGWQTASCMGAKGLPFEVDRNVLGRLIKALKDWEVRLKAAREDCANEVTPIVREWKGWRKEDKKQSFSFTRENFNSDEAQKALRECGRYESEFDDLLKIALANHDNQLRSLASDIKMHQKRFKEWKQTHEWKGGQWAAL